MKKANITPFIILIGLFIVLYVLLVPPEDRSVLLDKEGSSAIGDMAASQCITICEKSTQDLSSGPCLAENLLQDWVCDVAHNPRQRIDDEPSNQCTSYREGKSHHFVEVDEDCNLIRVV